MLDGKLTISRIEPNQIVRIAVIDELSKMPAIVVHVNPKEFALALTGLARTKCQFYPSSPMVGRRREIKHELVPFDPFLVVKTDNSEKQLKALLAPYEVDGWMAHLSDYRNHHNQRGKSVSVMFERYVDVE